MRRENRKDGSVFYGCSNHPYCARTQPPCPACGEGRLVNETGRCAEARAVRRSRNARGATDGWRSEAGGVARSWAARTSRRAGSRGTGREPRGSGRGTARGGGPVVRARGCSSRRGLMVPDRSCATAGRCPRDPGAERRRCPVVREGISGASGRVRRGHRGGRGRTRRLR